MARQIQGPGTWSPGHINPLHRVVWQGVIPFSFVGAVEKILLEHNVDAERLNLKMPFE
jgi:hypothetical protein